MAGRILMWDLLRLNKSITFIVKTTFLIQEERIRISKGDNASVNGGIKSFQKTILPQENQTGENKQNLAKRAKRSNSICKEIELSPSPPAVSPQVFIRIALKVCLTDDMISTNMALKIKYILTNLEATVQRHSKPRKQQ